MEKPNPMVQLMGGGALFTVAGVVYGAKIPLWARTAGATICVLMGIASVALALHAAFFQKKKVEAPKYVPKRAPRPVELSPEMKSKARVANDGGDEPPGPAAA